MADKQQPVGPLVMRLPHDSERAIVAGALFTRRGKAVLITIPCDDCGVPKDLGEFGLRFIDGYLRNRTTCFSCSRPNRSRTTTGDGR